MNKIILLAAILIALWPQFPLAGSKCNRETVEKIARQYMLSWYRGDAERMRECLHLKLSKSRLIAIDGVNSLRHIAADQMISYTGQGYGKGLLKKEETIKIFVLDIHQDIASVKVVTPHYQEYLHLARIDNRWVIVNALYEKVNIER